MSPEKKNSEFTHAGGYSSIYNAPQVDEYWVNAHLWVATRMKELLLRVSNCFTHSATAVVLPLCPGPTRRKGARVSQSLNVLATTVFTKLSRNAIMSKPEYLGGE